LREFEFERDTPLPSILTSLDILLSFRFVVGLLALCSRLLCEVNDSPPRFVAGGFVELNTCEFVTVLVEFCAAIFEISPFPDVVLLL
jgi:hypothetical protein